MASCDLLSDETLYRRVMSGLKNGALRPTDLSAAECNRVMRVAKTIERKARLKIARLEADGRRNCALKAQRSYLRSTSARLVAASAATHIPGGDPCERFPVVYDRADLIGFGLQPGEMRLKKKPKARGGTRITGSFSPVDHAQQKLMAKAVLPFYGDHPEQFAQRGRNFAVETLKDQVQTAGPDAVLLHGDVSKFYDNVSHEWLRDNVPLPASMAGFMLTSGYSLVSVAYGAQAHRVTEEEIARTARRGLPQGSALSPFVAELVIARMIQEIGSLRSCPLVNYSDNFGILCGVEEARRLEKALREDFRSHPAGPFDIRFTTTPVSHECRFSGYSFALRDNGECAFWVPEKHWLDRFAYWSDKLENEPPHRVRANIERMISYLHAFPLWEGRHTVRLEWEMQVTRILRSRHRSDLIPNGFTDPDAPGAPRTPTLCDVAEVGIGSDDCHSPALRVPTRKE